MPRTIRRSQVTATVLGDASRITFMARECAANLDDAPIYLPDIPTYFRSMWNKQAGRFQSICVPLHLAIFHKTKFDLVKLMIDLGADPNIYGRPKDHVKQWEKYNKKQRNATVRTTSSPEPRHCCVD